MPATNRHYIQAVNHRKPNYYRDGKFYLVQCWNCNDWKQNKDPNLGDAQPVDGAFGTTKIRSIKDYINGERNLPKMSVAWVNGDSVFA